uniref:53 kDa membrane antigen A n=1 Tax=Treponema denticola TaxID=158 RepID=TA53_TREDN|nr:RecName: Full=53 kDa membrane antigen A; Short=Protein A; Flags: Precursor [Treponema denticola]
MKKKLFFALLVLILSSCSLFFQKEYGTITIDLEGGRARSINSSTGLPNLADSELEIDILTEGNSSIYKKILASEPKFFQADFPIGSRLEITVKLNGPSSSWSAHNSHTVKEGNNDIRLLLNKNASSLANVGFSTAAVVNKYEFNIAGKRIDINSRELPVFTRDSRGRLYIAYKDINWKLNRYESDGTPNNFASDSPILTTITGASSVNLASDPVTGKVYVAADSNLYRIKDDGAVTPTGGTAHPAGPIAVYNNNLFVLGVSAVSGNNPLKMFTITEEGSVLTLNQAGSLIPVSTGQITISTSGSETTINVDFKDILVKKDKIYILFAKNNLPTPSTPSPYYSLGGMLEYTYNSSGVIDNPQKYGFNDTVTAGDDIVTAGEANFYGPACFIGYDEQSISIADDGCTFKKEGGSVRIYKNVNRIFSFNTSTKSLYSYATENKWFNEYEETATPPPPLPVRLARSYCGRKIVIRGIPRSAYLSRVAQFVCKTL